MPTLTVKSYAKKCNKPVEEVEKFWHKAKEIAKEEGQEGNYAYIMGIFKRMLSKCSKKESIIRNLLKGVLNG